MVSLESLLTELKENRYFNKVHLSNLTICGNEAPWTQSRRTTSLVPNSVFLRTMVKRTVMCRILSEMRTRKTDRTLAVF